MPTSEPLTVLEPDTYPNHLNQSLVASWLIRMLAMEHRIVKFVADIDMT